MAGPLTSMLLLMLVLMSANAFLEQEEGVLAEGDDGRIVTQSYWRKFRVFMDRVDAADFHERTHMLTKPDSAEALAPTALLSAIASRLTDTQWLGRLAVEYVTDGEHDMDVLVNTLQRLGAIARQHQVSIPLEVLRQLVWRGVVRPERQHDIKTRLLAALQLFFDTPPAVRLRRTDPEMFEEYLLGVLELDWMPVEEVLEDTLSHHQLKAQLEAEVGRTSSDDALRNIRDHHTADASDESGEVQDNSAEAQDKRADAHVKPANTGDKPANAGDKPANARNKPANAGDKPAKTTNYTLWSPYPTYPDNNNAYPGYPNSNPYPDYGTNTDYGNNYGNSYGNTGGTYGNSYPNNNAYGPLPSSDTAHPEWGNPAPSGGNSPRPGGTQDDAGTPIGWDPSHKDEDVEMVHNSMEEGQYHGGGFEWPEGPHEKLVDLDRFAGDVSEEEGSGGKDTREARGHGKGHRNHNRHHNRHHPHPDVPPPHLPPAAAEAAKEAVAKAEAAAEAEVMAETVAVETESAAEADAEAEEEAEVAAADIEAAEAKAEETVAAETVAAEANAEAKVEALAETVALETEAKEEAEAAAEEEVGPEEEDLLPVTEAVNTEESHHANDADVEGSGGDDGGGEGGGEVEVSSDEVQESSGEAASASEEEDDKAEGDVSPPEHISPPNGRPHGGRGKHPGRHRGHGKQPGHARRPGHGRRRGHGRRPGHGKRPGHHRRPGHHNRPSHHRRPKHERRRGHGREDQHPTVRLAREYVDDKERVARKSSATPPAADAGPHLAQNEHEKSERQDGEHVKHIGGGDVGEDGVGNGGGHESDDSEDEYLDEDEYLGGEEDDADYSDYVDPDDSDSGNDSVTPDNSDSVTPDNSDLVDHKNNDSVSPDNPDPVSPVNSDPVDPDDGDFIEASGDEHEGAEWIGGGTLPETAEWPAVVRVPEGDEVKKSPRSSAIYLRMEHQQSCTACDAMVNSGRCGRICGYVCRMCRGWY